MVGALRYRRPEPWSPLVGASMRRFLAVVCCIGLATVPNFTEGKQEIAVPAYVDPRFDRGCAWEVFKAGATIVVINPMNGPSAPDSQTLDEYKHLVSTVKEDSTVTTVLGYVATGYGIRDSSLVLYEIGVYYGNFATMIDGIFLDEGSSRCDSTNLTNYKSYDHQVKSYWGTHGCTALNWGDLGSECYLTDTKINTYCSYEDNYVTYTSSTYPPTPAWVFNYDTSSFWHIVYATPDDAASVQEGISLSKMRHAGLIYFMDAGAENPYDVSPSSIVWQTKNGCCTELKASTANNLKTK